MASVNKVILVGNLGKDPETRYLPNGDAVANFVVATSESWKDKATGEKKEETEWHRCSVFGKLAEICSQYLKKGSQVYLEGQLKTRKWQDKDGQDRYTTEIRVKEMRMLGSRGDSEGRSGSTTQPDQRAPEQSRSAQPAKKAPSFEDMDDDIPF